MVNAPKQRHEKHQFYTWDSLTFLRARRMPSYTGEESLQMVLDSEDEFTFSSEEDCDSDEEGLHFERRLDSRRFYFKRECAFNSSANRESTPASFSAQCHQK